MISLESCKDTAFLGYLELIWGFYSKNMAYFINYMNLLL